MLHIGGAMRTPDDCDEEDEGFATKTGDALVEHIRASTVQCLSRLFSNAPGSVRFAAFRADNMIHVADAMRPLASGYDGTNASNVGEIALFLRAGYYVAFYEGDDLDWAGRAEAIHEAVADAVDAFVDNDHLYDETEEHGEVLVEVVSLMDGAELQARYLPVARSWLQRWAPHHAEARLDRALNQIFVMLFRGHLQEDFVDATTTDTELMGILVEFALDDWMVDSEVEYLAANAGRELARFSQYRDASIYPTVQSGIQAILDRYDAYGEGRSIWVATAASAVHYDDCATYDICGFEDEMEARTLVIRHECSDSLRIRAQSLTAEQLGTACAVLMNQEAYFHRRLRTGNVPVGDDFNSTLEVVVFGDHAQYETLSGLFFGNATNNGGIYLEGDPADPENIPRFIAFVATWLDDRPIWNLAHEQVHYLDGRFDIHGAFRDYRVDTHATVWWLEGLAEYIAKGNGNATAVEVGRVEAQSLGDVLDVVYEDDTAFVYRWSYLAVRFMFERHRDAVDRMLGHFRNGDFDGYLEYLRGEIGTAHEEEWLEWLQEVAINDEETPGLVELPRALTMEEGTTAMYSVALATRPAAEVAVKVEPSSHLTVSNGSLTFTTENWDVAQTVTVTANDDYNTTLDRATLDHTAVGGGYDFVKALIAVEIGDNAPVIAFANPRVSVPEGGVAILTIAISEPHSSATRIGYAFGTDDDPGTSDADVDDHDGRDGEFTLDAGDTAADISVTVHDDTDIDPARETFTLSLDPSTITEFVHGATEAWIVIDEGVCDRSPGVRDVLRGSRHCSAVSVEDLAAKFVVDFSRQLDGSLRVGDFSGLTNASEMRLLSNSLTSLPDSIFDDVPELSSLILDRNELERLSQDTFDGLGKMSLLSLGSNNIKELPRGLFAGLGGLDKLILSHNELMDLPVGMFSGLANLDEVRLHGNPGAPFALSIEWSFATVAAGRMELVARLATGAPFDVFAHVVASNASLSAGSVVVPAGEVAAAPITVIPDGPGEVRVAFASVSGLPDSLCGANEGYDGYPCFLGLATAFGGPIVLADQGEIARVPWSVTLIGADKVRLELLSLIIDPSGSVYYAAQSSDPSLVSVLIEGGVLIISSHPNDAEGRATITVTATDGIGRIGTRQIEVTVEPSVRSWTRGWRVALVVGREESPIPRTDRFVRADR